MNLEEFIYKFNMSSTLTVKDMHEWCYVMNYCKDKSIDYSNSISIYDFVKIFNDEYLKFKSDYDKLEKEYFGKNIVSGRYNSYNDGNDRFLTLYIEEPRCDLFNRSEGYLSIIEQNGNIYSFIDNDFVYGRKKDYYRKELNLDKNMVRKYLDFLEKYKLFLKGYDTFKSDYLFGDGIASIFTEINGNLSNKDLEFSIYFSLSSFQGDDCSRIYFRLGDNFKILYDKWRIILDSEKKQFSKEIIDSLVSSSYINYEKLPSMYNVDKVKGLCKVKERV